MARAVLVLSLIASLPAGALPLSPDGFVTEWRVSGGRKAPVSQPGPFVDLAPLGWRRGKRSSVETELIVATAGSYRFRFGCDGSCTLFVGGSPVGSKNNSDYGAWIDDREVDVTLGVGTALVRIDADPPRRGPARIVLRVLPAVSGLTSPGSALLTDTPAGLAGRLPVEWTFDATPEGLVARVTLGPAAKGSARLTATLGGGVFNGAPVAVLGDRVSLSAVLVGEGLVSVRLDLTDGALVVRTETRTVRVDSAAIQEIVAARLAIVTTGTGSGDPDASASVRWWASSLAELLVRGEKDAGLVRDARKQLSAAVVDLEPARFAARSGAMVRAYTSPLDGLPQPYAVFVPPGGRSGLPLIVALHPSGYTPTRMLRATLGLGSVKGDTRPRLSRILPDGVSFPAVVVAPWGYDGTGSRYFGKVDVLHVLETVEHRHRTDPSRVLLTGGSLGGLGTWHIGLRVPDKFAAILPVAGFGSVRRYPNVRGVRLKPWERFLVDRRDNATFVENARHLPMRCVHGELDDPPRAKVIVDKYQALGCPQEYVELPGIGHAAWDDAYASRGALDFLSQHRRPDAPDRVEFVSGSYRHRQAYGVTIGQFGRPDALARVTTSRRGGTLTVRTSNVARFSLQLGPTPVRVDVDGAAVETASGVRHYRTEAPGRTVAAADPNPPLGEKRPGLSGPIDDIRYEPHLFVFGTALPDETDTNRRLAEALSRYGTADADIAVPVVADTAVTPGLMASHHLVLIGTRRSNRILAKIADSLPIRVTDAEVVVGSRHHTGRSTGVVFIAPNPLAPTRYVVVRTGITRRGVWLSAWLPEWLPDFVVFDEGIVGQRGGYLMDERRPLEAGFFSNQWTAP